MNTVPLFKPMSKRESAEHHREHHNETADSQLPDGPFSCGTNVTLGKPCIVHPCAGKCAIGVCGVPPMHTVTDSCQSLCMQIHEYECDCECREPWWETCAYIAGGVYNDTNGDDVLEIGTDPLLDGLSFNITLTFIDQDLDEVTVISEKTSTDGRFSFSQLAGGVYGVSVSLPDGYRIEDGGAITQIVTVTCLPPARTRHTRDDDDESSDTDEEDVTEASLAWSDSWQQPEISSSSSSSDSDRSSRHHQTKRSLVSGVRSQVLTVVKGKWAANHIADNVNFLVAPGEPRNDDHDHHHGAGGGGDSSSDNGSSGIVVAVIIIVAVLACAACFIWACFYSRRIQPPMSQLARARSRMQRPT